MASLELLAGIVEIQRLRDLAVSAGKGGKRGKNRPLMASVEKQEQQTSPGHHLLSLLKAIAELITEKNKMATRLVLFLLKVIS